MPVEGVRRPAWAEISRAALRHNVTVLRDVLGPTAICGVVKANGYGHGAVVAASAISEAGAAGLAVAIFDEGLELREANVTDPILVLAEAPSETLRDAFATGLTLTVGSLDGARAVAEASRSIGGRNRVHLKVDTGMHRMGIAAADLDAVLDVLLAAPTVTLEGIYTHFASADSVSPDDRAFAREQLRQFDEVLARMARRNVTPTIVHAANSAAALGIPESRRTMARIGLALYGYLPHPGLGSALADKGLELTPALSLHARVTAVRELAAGDRPSYGRRRPLPARGLVATVPFGYADGFPRRLFDAGATVLLNGREHPLAGAVTMDQLVIDCGDGPVAVGDPVVLLGTQGSASISAEQWASWSGTITWEILCGVGARVPRVVVD